MSDRRLLSTLTISLLAFALAACISTRPRISSIQSEPVVAKKEGRVAHSVDYTNPSQEMSYHDAVLTVRYSKYLRFLRSSSPYPDSVDEGQRELRWELGELAPQEKGSVRIEFELDSEIPLAVYELPVTAEISGTDSAGKRTTSERTAATLVEGHPTPTPTVTMTPRPTSISTPTVSTPSTRPTVATPAIKPEDCVHYDQSTLRIVPEKEIGWSLTVGKEGTRMLLLDTEADANDAKALAERHTALCYIGRDNTRANRETYIVEYWTGSSGKTSVIQQEDCLSHDPKALRIVDEGSAGWLLTDGRSRMLVLDDKQDAENSLVLASQHSQHCFIGRGNKRTDRQAYIVEYWR